MLYVRPGVSILIVATVATSAIATDFCEGPMDAGSLPPDAARVEGGVGPVDNIIGNLDGPLHGDPDFEDMYRICITDPMRFSAQIEVTDPMIQVDPQLWLFAAPPIPDGHGLLGNNGRDLGFQGALLLNMSTDGTGIIIDTPGEYYLAVSGKAPPGPMSAQAPVPVETFGSGPGQCAISIPAPIVLTGETCGQPNRCPAFPGPDLGFEVNIPFPAFWTFSVCGAPWDTVLMLSGIDCCLGEIAFNDNACGQASSFTVFLGPGFYALTLDSPIPGDCGPFQLVIEPSRGRVPQSDPPPPPGGLDIFQFAPSFEISGPDGPGGPFPIALWDGIGDIGAYTIALTGVEFCPPKGCVEDLDGSGAVDFGDILLILSAWGNLGGPEDLDRSGQVDFGDILQVLSVWGPCV